MLQEKDYQQLKKKGISPELVQLQIENFKRGFEYMKLEAPAIPGDGLIALDEDQVKALLELFAEQMKEKSALKFVPASGAASRMFKALFEFFELVNSGKDQNALLEEKGFNSPYNFFSSLNKFAFYTLLQDTLSKEGHDLDNLLENKDYSTILKYFLTDAGMNYGSLPKGLLNFHKYENGPRMAVEEHFVEGMHYAASSDGIIKLHFTVSAEHTSLFQDVFETLIPKYEQLSGLKFDVRTSLQKPSTDTIAVEMNNEPFRLHDGTLLFRPAGHGALIENLNDLDEDVIFIKNIDNITTDQLREDTYTYKKVLAGLLLKHQDRIFSYLELLDDANLTDEDLSIMLRFIEQELQQKLDVDWDSMDQMEKIDFLYTWFNRPIRVCGMVKNEGEPGGGPFRVMKDNESTLQIVEGSQINMEDPKQVEILKRATHFNPVDLICGIRNYKGDKFNLLEFVDPETGFISIKSKDGRDLKAQELPGLWNGAMAHWITLFVEVPITTFSPVKTINDLLRPQHQ
jgi:hypothetical protein